MPRLPDVTDFGARPVKAAVRRPAAINPNAAAAAGIAAANLGADIAGIGERRADRQANFALATARSNFLRESIKADADIPQGQDYTGWVKSYQDRMNAARAEFGRAIPDARAREAFELETGDALVRGAARIEAAAKGREVDAGRAALSGVVGGNVDAAVGFDDPATREALLRNANEAITAALEQGYITEQESVTQRRSLAEDYAERRVGMLPAPARAAVAGRRGSGNVPEEIGALIATAAGNPEDERILRRFAALESAFDPAAQNPSGASGLFQFMPATARQYGLADPFDPAASAQAAARLLADNRRFIGGVLGRTPDGAELYLAHQQGAGGAAALLRNPDMNVVDALAIAYKGDREFAAKAVSQNGGKTTMTAGAFADLWRRKYDAASRVDVADAGGDGGLARFLPADKLQKIGETAQREVDQDRAQARRAWSQGFSDYVSAVQSGADVDPAAAALYSDAAINAIVEKPEDRRLYRETRDDALLAADVSARLRGASLEDMAALGREIAERADGVAYDAAGLALAPSRAQAAAAFQRAVQADWKARTDDPAAYALQSSDAVSDAAAGLGQGGGAAYAEATLAEQTRLGVPRRMRRLLGEAQAKDMAAGINELSAEDVGPAYARMAQEWGPHFDALRAELETAGVNPEAHVAGLYAGEPATAQAIAAVAGVERGTLIAGLDSTIPTDVRTRLASEMEDFRRAFTMGDGSGAAQRQFAALFDIAERMALQDVAKSADPAAAVERTFKRLVGDVYEVIETANINAYLPKRGVDVAAVEDAADALLTAERLEAADLDTLGSLMGAPEAVKRARALTAARQGTWVTNDAADGLVLVMDMGDGSTLPVLRQDGTPYGFRFDEAAGLAMGDATDNTVITP